MFKAKRKTTGEILQVLDVYCDEVFASTYFFVWENGGWRWRPADSFVPPNWEEEDNG